MLRVRTNNCFLNSPLPTPSPRLCLLCLSLSLSSLPVSLSVRVCAPLSLYFSLTHAHSLPWGLLFCLLLHACMQSLDHSDTVPPFHRLTSTLKFATRYYSHNYSCPASSTEN